MKILLALAFLGCAFAFKDYTNYKIYEITATKENLPDLAEWQIAEGVDFLYGPGKINRIMVSPEANFIFTDFLKSFNYEYEIVSENVEIGLERDRQERMQRRTKQDNFMEPNFGVYWTAQEMNEYSIYLALHYPELVQRDVIGTSAEGREIFGLRIHRGGGEFGRNPVVFVDGGCHAREWAAHASVMYLVHELITNATVTNELLDGVDWLVVPMMNPDGYHYSMVQDRMWRKNRRVINATCTGVDLNRNFPYQWQYLANSCTSLAHPGPNPLSEPESAAYANYLLSHNQNLRLSLSTHTFGNMVLWPYGYAFNVYISNWVEHDLAGRRWVDAIQAARGTNYIIGNSADILYTANGATDDFAAGVVGATLAYTLELTGGGSTGFDFPESQIYNLVTESFIGYRAMGLYVKEHFFPI